MELSRERGACALQADQGGVGVGWAWLGQWRDLQGKGKGACVRGLGLGGKSGRGVLPLRCGDRGPAKVTQLVTGLHPNPGGSGPTAASFP